jgi:hypothetical protein
MENRTLWTGSWIGRLALSLFGAALLGGFMVPTSGPPPNGIRSIPLSDGPILSSRFLFAAKGTSEFFFFDPIRSRTLWILRVSHPMGSQNFVHETWNPLHLPDLGTLRDIRDMAFANDTIFLSGRDENDLPIVRAYPITGTETSESGEITAASHTDFYPPSGGAPIRNLLYDAKTRVLWMSYDNGRIQVGPHIIGNPNHLILDAPAGYLALGEPPNVRNGPPSLPIIRTPKAPGDACLTCTLFVVERAQSPTADIRNIPVRSPEGSDSRLGLFPFGNRTILLKGSRAFACGMRIDADPPLLKPCLPVDPADLPLASGLSGQNLIFLNVSSSGYSLDVLNPEYVDARVVTGAPLAKGFLDEMVRDKGEHHLLPPQAKPIPFFFAVGSRRAVVFGHQHLYRLTLGKPEPAKAPPGTPAKAPSL